MSKTLVKKLDTETLAEIQRSYLEILRSSGYGTIKVRVERAGGKNESHFVKLEIEKKTR